MTNLYFGSFADKKGNVTRAGIDGAQALRYIRSLGPKEFQPGNWRPANPSHLLPVLLLCGAKLKLGSAWDLRALDRLANTSFIPTDYRDFGASTMEAGMNYTHHVGTDFWNVSESHREFMKAFEKSLVDTMPVFPEEGKVLAVASSLLFPDRVPFFLERLS